MRHGGRNWLQALAPRQQPFVFSGSGVLIHVCLLCWLTGRRSAAGPVSFKKKRENDGERDSIQQRLESRLIMLEPHRGSPAADAHQKPSEDRAQQGAESEVQEIDDAGAVPLNSGGLASLMTV